MFTAARPRGLALGFLALSGLTGACASARQPASSRSCEPATATPRAGAEAQALAGAFHLTIVAVTGPAAGARVDGDLRLWAVPETSRSGGGRGRTAVLFGSADVALDRVGAAAPGALDATDPAAPGVLVLEQSGPSGSRILLRFGAEANRQDLQPFESRYMVLEVQAADRTGFQGAWRSGLTDTEADGYFCAWRR